MNWHTLASLILGNLLLEFAIKKVLFFLTQIADSMTAAEKSLVAKIHSMNDQLTLGQTQVDETILILETYLKFLVPK